MRKRVISLLMAAVFLLTASVFSISVAAATEPIIILDDFEDYTGGMPASATYANNTHNLSAVQDDTYGTAMKHTKNSRLNFGFPDTTIKSGKVYLAFDIKFANSTADTFALTYYNSEGNPEDDGKGANGSLGSGSATALSLGSAQIFAMDNAWHSLEYLMDITTGNMTVYHNGETVGTVALNTLKENGFGFVRFQETGADFYLDNLRLIASDSDVLEMYAENTSAGKLSLDFTRSVKNMSELTAANVSIKNVLTGNTVTVNSVTPVGLSRLNVAYDTTGIVAGAEYAVTVNGVEFVADAAVATTAMFNTEGGDKVETVLDDPIDNFAGLGDENDWSVYKGHSSSAYHTNYASMAEKTTEGMKITLNEWTTNEYKQVFSINHQFDNIIKPEGVITVEMKIYNDNVFELYPILYGKDTNGETSTNVWTRLGGFNSTPGFIGYIDQDKASTWKDGTTNRPWLKSVSFDQWYTILTEFDFDNNVARFKIASASETLDAVDWIVSNGTAYPAPLRISNYNNVTKSTFGGFEGFAIVGVPWLDEDANGCNASYTVDYVKVTQTLPNPVISKIRFVDYQENEVLPSSNIDAEVDTVKVYFSTDVNSSTLANAVTLTGTNAPTVTFDSYDSTAKCATYKFSDYLMGSQTYTLTISDAITDADGNQITNAGEIEFNTNAGKLIIKSFGFDKADLAAANVNDVINISVDIINTRGDGKDAQLSYGVYNDRFMTDFNYLPVEMDDTKASYEESLPITVKDLNKLTIKGFLWDSFETIRPIIGECTLTNIAD